ncbi:cytotoxic and regulatory T-cell molecule [Polymixia lowei]
MEGMTLTLKCPIRNAHMTNVEWKNPKGYVMFFNHNKALKNKRYSIDKLSNTEFTVSVSNVTFKDGGNYTCLHYSHNVAEKIVEVTVLGQPKMEVARHGKKMVVKCSAEANHFPPQIYWDIDTDLEIAGQAHHLHENGKSKYVSVDMLHILSAWKRVQIKCVVRHPALHVELMNFVEIGPFSTKFPRTTSTRSPTTQLQMSTDTLRTTHRPQAEGTTDTSTATDLYRTSSEGSVRLSTLSSDDTETVNSSPGSHLSTINESNSSVSDSTRTQNDTISNVTSTTGWSLSSDVTDENISHNGTEGNMTRGTSDKGKQTETEGSSSLLVLLVTCLIFALLVVVIFFAIKLRRAHILWKRENEDSEQSMESSKSKTSHEERQSQAQRRKGLFNIGFTHYAVEEQTEISTATNKSAMSTIESIRKQEASQHHMTSQTEAVAKSHIKETEL